MLCRIDMLSPLRPAIPSQLRQLSCPMRPCEVQNMFSRPCAPAAPAAPAAPRRLSKKCKRGVLTAQSTPPPAIVLQLPTSQPDPPTLCPRCRGKGPCFRCDDSGVLIGKDYDEWKAAHTSRQADRQADAFDVCSDDAFDVCSDVGDDEHGANVGDDVGDDEHVLPLPESQPDPPCKGLTVPLTELEKTLLAAYSIDEVGGSVEAFLWDRGIEEVTVGIGEDREVGIAKRRRVDDDDSSPVV